MGKKYYNEITALPEGIVAISTFCRCNTDFNCFVSSLNKARVEKNLIGFVTEEIPRRVQLNILAKQTSVDFIFKSVESQEVEPELILEYKGGKLVDEQKYKRPIRRRI